MAIDYLFIFRSDGCGPVREKAFIGAPQGDASFVGVSTVDQACEVAAKALAAGTADFIELCGDFGEDGCRRVIAAVEGKLPVGYVTYLQEEEPKIEALFGAKG